MTMPYRLHWEVVTIEKMLRLYCKKHHKASGVLCEECQILLKYACKRIEKCQFQAHKPVCGNCKIHCYSKAYRGRIREVMRWAGPRMLLYHPCAAIQHLYYKFTKKGSRLP